MDDTRSSARARTPRLLSAEEQPCPHHIRARTSEPHHYDDVARVSDQQRTGSCAVRPDRSRALVRWLIRRAVPDRGSPSRRGRAPRRPPHRRKGRGSRRSTGAVKTGSQTRTDHADPTRSTTSARPRVQMRPEWSSLGCASWNLALDERNEEGAGLPRFEHSPLDELGGLPIRIVLVLGELGVEVVATPSSSPSTASPIARSMPSRPSSSSRSRPSRPARPLGVACCVGNDDARAWLGQLLHRARIERNNGRPTSRCAVDVARGGPRQRPHADSARSSPMAPARGARVAEPRGIRTTPHWS